MLGMHHIYFVIPAELINFAIVYQTLFIKQLQISVKSTDIMFKQQL